MNVPKDTDTEEVNVESEEDIAEREYIYGLNREGLIEEYRKILPQIEADDEVVEQRLSPERLATMSDDTLKMLIVLHKKYRRTLTSFQEMMIRAANYEKEQEEKKKGGE